MLANGTRTGIKIIIAALASIKHPITSKIKFISKRIIMLLSVIPRIALDIIVGSLDTTTFQLDTLEVESIIIIVDVTTADLLKIPGMSLIFILLYTKKLIKNA